MRKVCLLFLLLAFPAAADPLNSARWNDMRELFFKGEKLEFDARVKVVAPKFAEDSMNIPAAVDARELADVQEIMVFADFNPIIKVLEFYPRQAKAYLAFRFKLQQSSPLRAAAKTRDGVWHVGGAWVEASGGGCTAPSNGRVSGNWAQHLGEVSSRVRGFPHQQSRVRFKVMHPMDTGLAAGIPAFYIEQMSLKNAQGSEILRLNTFEPVSENPVFTFDLPELKPGQQLLLTGVDNNGNRINAGIRQ
ncbi:MAG: quinoprotein dehydrogenase-associated SoxYZ-like carrier [Burkholderiales bacterium]